MKSLLTYFTGREVVCVCGGAWLLELLVRCVPMLEEKMKTRNKNDGKAYCFQAGLCAALSLFRTRKNLFCRESVCSSQFAKML